MILVLTTQMVVAGAGGFALCFHRSEAGGVSQAMHLGHALGADACCDHVDEGDGPLSSSGLEPCEVACLDWVWEGIDESLPPSGWLRQLLVSMEVAEAGPPPRWNQEALQGRPCLAWVRPGAGTHDSIHCSVRITVLQI